MNKKIVKKWVEALMSGEYKQGSGTLFNTHFKQHCCLGVLCELAAAEKICRVEASQDTYFRSFDNNTGCLPDSVKVWINITNHLEEGLIRLNDKGVPFEGIAGVINEASKY